MFLPTTKVLVHKLSELDIKCAREIFRAEEQLKDTTNYNKLQQNTTNSSTSMCSDVAQRSLFDTVVDLLFDDAYKNGNTALHLAFLKYGPGFIFDSLLEVYLKNTTRNLANEDGLTFLHMACTRPCISTVEVLLQRSGMNLNCRVFQRSTVFSGFSPLHFAVQYGQYHVAGLLLRHNANLYALDRDNFSTPLHMALEQCNAPMIDLLLAYDRRRENTINMWGLSHFMVACAGNDILAVVEYIRQAQELDRNDFINDTVEVGHKFAGYTPLRFAMKFRRSDTVQILKHYGAVLENKTDEWSEDDILNIFNNMTMIFTFLAFSLYLLMIFEIFFGLSLNF